MSKTNESGHAVNVDNFSLLGNFCGHFGLEYNPTQSIITLTSIKEIKANSLEALKYVDIKFALYTQAVNQRQNAFEPLGKLTTRIINMLDASGAPDNTVKDARTIVRKIQGRRAHENSEATTDKVNENKISASQQSFANMTANFLKLIEFIKSEKTYTPNNKELTVAALENMYNKLFNANDDVHKAYVQLRTARNNRDQVLYNSEKGLNLCKPKLTVLPFRGLTNRRIISLLL
jgi:hypothetical protein